MHRSFPQLPEAIRRAGQFAAGLRFNSVTPVEIGGSRYVRKSRLHRAAILTHLANWYAAGTGMMMRVLSRPVWLRHEVAMYRLLLAREAQVVRGMLLLPRLPGRPLSCLLQESRGFTQVLERGLRLAVTELARLHGCWTPHPWHGGLQRFSHADATIRNVLIDADREQAHWIDFDTTHPAGLAPSVRHADDLLTLICGTAATLPPADYPRLCEVVVRDYRSRPVTEALENLLRRWDQHPVARRLALPSLEDHEWRRLRQVVR